MIFEIDKASILSLVCHQVENSFMLTYEERIEIEASFDEAISDCEKNFLHQANKYFTRVVNNKIVHK